MKNKIFILVLMVAILSFSSFSLAKDESDKPSFKLKRWRISMNMGLSPTSFSPARKIEEQMVDNNYYGTVSYWFFGGETVYPRSEPMLAGSINVDYLIKPTFLIGALISIASGGTTKGYNDELGFLTVDYAVNTYAVVFSFRYDDVFQLGIGPAWHAAKVWRSDAGVSGPTNTAGKLGYVVDFGITVKQSTPLYFELKVQYRGIGQVEIGPYENKRLTPFGEETVVFPKTGASYNYLCFGVGVGIRF